MALLQFEKMRDCKHMGMEGKERGDVRPQTVLTALLKTLNDCGGVLHVGPPHLPK